MKRILEQLFNIKTQTRIPKVGKTTLIVAIVFFVFLLAVLQDYIYSRLYHTGFYISESLLYNSFWTLFVPFTLIANRLIKSVNSKKEWRKLPLNLVIAVALSFLHIVLFASLFVLVSNLVFTPPHRFSNIFNAALSNQLYIAIIWYTLFPFLINSKTKRGNSSHKDVHNIKLKIGTRIISVPRSSIQLISTDKPYSTIYTQNQKYLDNKSLKEFEDQLDSTVFLRVHRSAIINSAFIKELKSRSNGDYDAMLQNGQLVRLSRHFRNNWKHLLQ